ncbi:MAG: CFI-box-CTERM domain-containing protein [Oscillospiraceae bacterium]
MGRYSNLSPNRKAGKEFFNSVDKMLKPKKRRKKGCYVATCVYGSYDCPEVWTLRRFRDYTLDRTWYGKLFICFYYTISPIIIKFFGSQKWFKVFWRKQLDKMVSALKSKGVADTEYEDKY